MRLFVYDNSKMQYHRVRILPAILSSLFLLVLSCYMTYTISFENGYDTCCNDEPIESGMIFIGQPNIPEFSEEALVALLKDLNIKYPHIVLAQAKLETGDYQSDIFRANHNLFGMKQARIRVNIARGTNLGHAYYDNWVESVYDYAFYQATYLSDLKSEKDYFRYLDMNYAEADHYVSAVKRIIRKNNLKDYFE